MNFESIARKACERHDYVLAVVTLCRGLKRLDEVDSEAFDLLIDLYANFCQAPGLEREVADVLVRHFDVGLISGQIITCLEARDLFSMSRAFRREMLYRGVFIEEVSLESLTLEQERIEDAPDEAYDDPLPTDDLLDHAELSELSELSAPTHTPGDLDEDEDHDESEESDPLDLPDARFDAPHALLHGEESDGVFEPPREITWTDEQERDAPSPDSPPLTHPTVISTLAPSPTRRLGRRVALVLIIVSSAIVMGIMVCSPPRGARVQALEQQLTAFDTLNSSAFELLLEVPNEELEEGARARMDFARMLLALERGEVVPSSSQDGEGGVWPRGAAVFQALQRRDVEAALAHVEAMERRWPDELATLWTRARLEEERGHFQDAQRAYALARHRTPRFLPGLMGAVRVAFYQGSHRELERAQADLREFNPLHPYLSIQSDPLQRAILRPAESGEGRVDPVPRSSTLSEDSKDRFARAYHAYLSASEMRARGDLSAAHSLAREALSLEPHMSPALLLQGVLLAAQLRVDEASQLFARYASLEQLDVLARVALMVYAPRALTRAGRPDLALIFALDPGGDSARSTFILEAGEPLVSQQEQWRPISLNLTREQRDQHVVPTEMALAELAWALLDLGKAQEALQLTRQLNADTYRYLDDLQWFAYEVMGATQRLIDLAYQHRDKPVAPYTDLLAALASSELMRAHSIVTAHPELARRQMFWLRAATRAQLFATPRQDVLASLDRVEFTALPGELARQRMIVWAMLDPQDKRYVELHEAQLAGPITSLHALIDMAYAALWQADVEHARDYIKIAGERASDHPEVIYIQSLDRALAEDEQGLQELFRRATLSESDPVWLLDVAELALRHKNAALAYAYFQKFARCDEVHPVLLDRAGRALSLLDSGQAQQVLEALEARYRGNAQGVVHRSKVLRWMAVNAGVRKGRKEGNDWLDVALELEGVPQDELWLEKGRYFMANTQNKRARDSFTQALRYNSSLAEAHAELGELALAAEQVELARDHFIKYLEWRPYGTQSASVREKLDRLQNDSPPPTPTTPSSEAAAP